MIRVSGKAIWLALENSVSLYPALEGRFPQVSGITFDFDPSMPPFQRVRSASIGGQPMDLERSYLLASRDYMVRGKDGYTSLVSDDVEVVVGPEEGDRIYKIVLEAFSQLAASPFQAPLQFSAGDDVKARVSQKPTVNGVISPVLEGRIAVI
jgi:5'-nucleotidase